MLSIKINIMKRKFFVLALFAALLGLSACSNLQPNYPEMYVVNGSDYSVEVYCDNHFVTAASAHNNSGQTTLDNVSINLPVYVELYHYDTKGNYVRKLIWENYYFRWDKTYKMTITNSGATLLQL